jgi:hypothetical protein
MALGTSHLRVVVREWKPHHVMIEGISPAHLGPVDDTVAYPPVLYVARDAGLVTKSWMKAVAVVQVSMARKAILIGNPLA